MTTFCRWMGGIRAACLGVAAMLLATSAVLAVEAGPDNPRKHYWLRNTGARVVERGPMDARLREIADAFGQGELEQARTLAENLLAATEDANLRAEAAAFLVQGYLEEGDFESARAAAARISDAESLARINRIEAEYKAEVGRLQRIVATTKDPAEAAHAQFLTARAHEGVHCLDVAVESYWKVVRRYPEHPPSASAARWLLAMEQRSSGNPAAVSLCRSLVAAEPNGQGAVGSLHWLFARAPTPAVSRSGLHSLLREVRDSHPGTLAAAEARSLLARLAVEESTEARERGAHLMAVGVLEEALEDLPVDSPQRPEVLHALGLAHQRVSGRGQESDAIWCFAEVLEGHPSEARRLGSRYQLGVSYYRLGSYEEAIREFERYLRECPEGPLAGFAQERVEQCRDMLDARRSPSSNQ